MHSYRDALPFEMMTIRKEAEYMMNCKPLTRCLGNKDDTLANLPIDLMTVIRKSRCGEILTAAPRHGDELCRGHDYMHKKGMLRDPWIVSYLL